MTAGKDRHSGSVLNVGKENGLESRQVAVMRRVGSAPTASAMLHSGSATYNQNRWMMIASPTTDHCRSLTDEGDISLRTRRYSVEMVVMGVMHGSALMEQPWVDSIIGSAGDAYSLSVGSNPIRPVSKMRIFPFQPDALDIERNQDPPCGSSSIGRAPAFQVGGCEIIARLSLH